MEYRLYSFVNYYLSDIQRGIQTGHCAVDLVRKYEQSKIVKEWADHHKTFIILNGGNNASMRDIRMLAHNAGFPWASFSEDDISLGGLMTCVSVLLDENFFNAKIIKNDLFGDDIVLQDGTFIDRTSIMFNFLYLLKTSKLA